MDKIEQYRELIIKAVTESYHYRFPPKDEGIETLFLRDEQQNQYMLYQMGWSGQHPINNVIILMRIKQGKIWIDEDLTEYGVVTDLLRWGVPPSDIVQAWLPSDTQKKPESVLA